MTTLAATVTASATLDPAPPSLWRDGPPPANDDFANAEAITLDLNTSGRMVGSTVEADEFDGFTTPPYPAGTPADLRAAYTHSTWYTVTLASDDILHLRFDGDSDAAEIAVGRVGSLQAVVYSASVSSPTQADLVQLGGAALGAYQTFEQMLTAGTYYIQVVQTADSDALPGLGLADYVMLASAFHDPPVLEAVVDGGGHAAMSTVSGEIGMLPELTATVGGSSVAVGNVIWNGSYATVVAGVQARGFLRIGARDDVGPYLGESTIVDGLPQDDVFPMAGVTMIEYIGSAGSELPMDEYLNLLDSDQHSTDLEGYIRAPLGPAAGTVYSSTERWLRLRFLAPFNAVAGLRVWMQSTLAAGWAMYAGFAHAYATPSGALSTVATTPMPTADPGPDAPNLLDSVVLGPDDDAFSLWLVLQARADGSVGNRQPIGYVSESWEPLPIQLRLAWVET